MPKSRKRISICIIIAIALAMLTVISLLAYGINDAKTKLFVPQGFVSLSEWIADSDGAFDYVFWESQISILDAQGKCIYQTDVKDDAFIVKYRGEYFVDQNHISLLMETIGGKLD